MKPAKPYRYWSHKSIAEDAKKYRTRKQWQKNSSGYKAARRRGILDEVCGHMTYRGVNRLSSEEIFLEAKKYKSKAEWRSKARSSYASAVSQGLLKQACSHMSPVPTKWTLELLKKDALKYKNKRDWRKHSRKAYDSASKRGILNDICGHMECLGGKSWTDEDIFLDAKQYGTRSEWQKKSVGWQLARKRGLLDKACAHMSRRYKIWTTKLILEDALKYSSKMEWKRKSFKAYCIAHFRGIVDQACSHMKRMGGTSFSEQQVAEYVKSKLDRVELNKYFSNPNKQCNKITRFQLDVYFPDIKKGIEFDGDYWHSVEALKRTRPHWEDHELARYSEIKDDFFKQFSITILHIKESEWKSNKDNCLKIIDEFLDGGTSDE